VVITSSGLDLDIAVTGAMDDDDALMWVQPDRDGDGVYENLFDDGRNFVPANSALMDLTLTTDDPHDRTVDVLSLKPGLRYRMWAEAEPFKGRRLVHSDPITVPLAGVWLTADGSDEARVTVQLDASGSATFMLRGEFLDAEGNRERLDNVRIAQVDATGDELFSSTLGETFIGGTFAEMDGSPGLYSVTPQWTSGESSLFFVVRGERNGDAIFSRQIRVDLVSP